MNKRNIKIIISLVFSFILVNVIIYGISEMNKQQRIKSALDSHLSKLEIHYKTLIYHWKVTANAAYRSTSGMKKVVEILSKVQGASSQEKLVLRKQLYNTMLNKFKALNTKGVEHFSFILPDNTAFLRMSKPEKFGDNIANTRYSIKYVNETKKQISGYGQGKISPAFRNSFPIFDSNNNCICALEISFSSDNIQNYLAKVSKIHTHFLINKNILDAIVWRKDDFISKYIPSIEHIDYKMSIVYDNYEKKHLIKNADVVQQIKTQIDKKIAKGKKFALYSLCNNKAVVVSFYPIKNIKDKKTAAWIVSYDNDDFINITLKGNLIIRIVTFFVSFILFYFVYRVLNQKEILNIQVKEKTDDLAEMNRELEESEYELQIINENLEVMVKEEVEKNQEKDRLVFQQSKMASMGEMIGNIAHQWRQPIAIISMWANNIIADVDMSEVKDENLRKYADNINEQTKHLSQTIDDFRNFFTPNKEKTTFTLKSSIDKTMSLLSASFKTHNIEVIQSIEDIQITALENELTQAILNIIKNAKDILVTFPNSSKKLIFVNIFKKNNEVIIEIKDNGGGVPKEIIDKIFEPYFTTKHKSLGTGIGLYMTESIIVKHLDGKLLIENVEYEYAEQKYNGAKFTIEIPINK